MHEQPAARMDESSTRRARLVSKSLSHACDPQLSGVEQVDSRESLVSNGESPSVGLDVDSGVVGEVLEEGFVGSSQGELGLGNLRHHGKSSLCLQKKRFSKYVALKHYILLAD